MEDYERTDKPIGELFKDLIVSKKKTPPHEKSAIVNEIIEIVGTHKTYNYKYWLRKIGNRSYNEMQGILKEIKSMPQQYSKGGRLTNILSNKKNNA